MHVMSMVSILDMVALSHLVLRSHSFALRVRSAPLVLLESPKC